jgi:hypothetical protein
MILSRRVALFALEVDTSVDVVTTGGRRSVTGEDGLAALLCEQVLAPSQAMLANG